MTADPHQSAIAVIQSRAASVSGSPPALSAWLVQTNTAVVANIKHQAVKLSIRTLITKRLESVVNPVNNSWVMLAV